jgi:hypothetical protein
VNKGAGIVCPETEVEDAMVSGRQSEQNGRPPGPAMQQGIEAALYGAFNLGVVGSIPTGLTKEIIDIR